MLYGHVTLEGYTVFGTKDSRTWKCTLFKELKNPALEVYSIVGTEKLKDLQVYAIFGAENSRP